MKTMALDMKIQGDRLMPKYEVNWSKTYYTSGYVEIEANSTEEAEKIARDNIGDYEGSMQYDGDADFVEAYEQKKVMGEKNGNN